MTKKQRAELALQRRKDQVRQDQQQQQDERSQRNAFMAAARAGGSGSGDRYASRQDGDQQRQREATIATKELEKQKEALKRQYLGSKKEKKKVLKPSEKFRFSFDWEASDDTSRDLNPLYQNKHETQLLFGRGMRAGIDRVVQVKEGHKYLKEVQRRKDDHGGGARRGRSSGGASGGRDDPRPEESREERERRHEDEDRLQHALDRKEARMKDSDLGLTGAHWSDKKLDDMTERDWRIFKEDFQIAVKGGRCPKPIRSWAESGLPPQLLKAIAEAGYEKPSAIQMQSIPIGLINRDMIGLAETGSGKTAAFVLPMLSYIMNHCPELTPEIAEEGPFALIMAPTRELVQQIEGETKKFSRHLGYKVFSIVGGVNIEEQGYALRMGAHIIIATPGRLNDCLDNGYMVLNQCNYIVLDEADRMIDLGFAPQIQSVLDAMSSTNMRPEDEEDEEAPEKQDAEEAADKPLYRQTFLFSATMPPAVEKLAKKYCRVPAIIQIGETGRVVDRIEQVVKVVSEGAKPRELESVMQDLEPPIIVFVNTRAHCDSVSKKIDEIGFNSTILHGGKLQDQRENSINGFREGRYDVLVATNVAGRGIDIPDVQAVVNYDVPKNIQDYTHRIGRTGRAGKRGLAVSLLTMEDTDIMYDLKQMLTSTNSIVPRELEHAEAARVKPGEIKQFKKTDLDK